MHMMFLQQVHVLSIRDFIAEEVSIQIQQFQIEIRKRDVNPIMNLFADRGINYHDVIYDSYTVLRIYRTACTKTASTWYVQYYLRHILRSFYI